MSQIFGQMHSVKIENMMNSNQNSDDNEMEDGHSLVEQLKLFQKSNKLNELQNKLSEIATFNQIEFIHLIN